MRVVSWFSCGAASAVATKLAVSRCRDTQRELVIAYCEVKEEHPDNMRFLKDCEDWFGQEILILGNDKYQRSIYEVFASTRYLVGPGGARCTGELKKKVRESFQRPDDLQILGFTVEEQHRIDRFIDANNDVKVWPILLENQLTKQDCLGILSGAGIEIPAMYKLGYHNNNCIGCVKGEAGYWNKIRKDFPEAFERMNQMEKHLGRTVCKIDAKTAKEKYGVEVDSPYWRPTLDQLPEDAGEYPKEMDIECGIFCLMAEQDIAT